jgi:hypothetical protein
VDAHARQMQRSAHVTMCWRKLVQMIPMHVAAQLSMDQIVNLCTARSCLAPGPSAPVLGA